MERADKPRLHPMTGGKTILFVCRHGAAKSVLAAAEWDRLAAERGVPTNAEAAGIEPEDRISPTVIEILGPSHAALDTVKPRRVAREDLQNAWRVVTFNLEPGDFESIGPGADLWLDNVVGWDDVPPVSEQPEAARAAIDRHIQALLDAEPVPPSVDQGPSIR
jgi:arsenate reductase